MASDVIFKKYLKAKGKDCTHIKVELYYSLGGMNYFTGRTEGRGYYLSVTPVSREVRDNGWISESYTSFTGTKWLLKEVARKSVKAATDATKLAELNEQRCIDYVLAKQEIVLV